MTKILYTIRHAQAENGADIKDFDRKLTSDGERQAGDLAKHMTEKSYNPGVFLVSSAARTQGTFFCLGMGEQQIVKENFYDGTAGDYLEEIKTISDDKDEAAVIGHNPSISDLTRFLVEKGADEVRLMIMSGFKKGMMVAVKFDTDHWAEIGAVKGNAFDVFVPQE